MLETEELGVSILQDLHQQRQSLLHAHKTVCLYLFFLSFVFSDISVVLLNLQHVLSVLVPLPLAKISTDKIVKWDDECSIFIDVSIILQLHGVDENVSKSKKILTAMSRRMSRNKWIIGSVIAALVLAILFILYYKLTHQSVVLASIVQIQHLISHSAFSGWCFCLLLNFIWDFILFFPFFVNLYIFIF